MNIRREMVGASGLTETLQLWMMLGCTSKVEERNERLVADFLDNEAKWVGIVGNALKRGDDRRKNRAAGN